MKDKHIIWDEWGCKVRDENGDTVKLKRLYMMYTLSEAFEMFCEQHPKVKISQSTFCNCMPDHVMLRANTPTDMCLCTYHENIHLLVNGIEKLPSLTDLLKLAVCNAESQKLMFQLCECCGKLSLWKQYCTNNFADEELQGEICYGQWMKNNFGRLERSKLLGAVSEVIKSIDERLESYLFHVFIKRSQAASFVERKGNLKIGQALFHFDLSENYPFVPQDEIQSGHWDHTSCTLFTAIVHFKDTKDNLLKKKPFIIVSDYTTHNKYA